MDEVSPKYFSLFVRGFVLVALVSANTRQIANGRYVGAFVVGFLITTTWWWNSRSAAHADGTLSQVVYALGAACGTVVGMWLAG